MAVKLTEKTMYNKLSSAEMERASINCDGLKRISRMRVCLWIAPTQSSYSRPTGRLAGLTNLQKSPDWNYCLHAPGKFPTEFGPARLPQD